MHSKGSSHCARIAATLALAMLALAAMSTSALANLKNPQSNIVSQSGAPGGPIPANTHYFTTIQAAVNASRNGDWVLIEPGVYKEEVKVLAAQHGVHIRGLNRNSVVLDGEGITTKGGANGIEVHEANNVWIENLTARNFEKEGGIDGPGGNAIWWNGGEGSGKVKAHGWWGSYLTAYDTGLAGGYGIFTSNETTGVWNHIYASGFNDSGIYLGACQECRALINDATIENNAVGYSGSNSGGELVIQNSVFRHNSDGIVPNSENPGDGPPPSDGQCHRRNVPRPSPTPSFTTTAIERCEIFRKNLVTENSNLTVPATTATIKSPYGAGIELPGTYAMDVEENTITKNPTDGILAFEYPNPYPPTEKTIYFELAGNRFAKNTFAENGGAGGTYAGDIFMQGGVFAKGKSQSTMNCVGTGADANTFADATFPAQASLESTWGCQNATTPNPNLGISGIEWLLYLQGVSEAERKPTAQPAPAAQETMPHPCSGVPANPVCPTEEAEPYSRVKGKHRKS